MAVAKKRKGAVRRTGSSSAKVKKLLAKAQADAEVDPRMKRWARKLHSSRLMYLRNDPDFLTMVKIGRAMNSITYCITSITTFDQFETDRTHMRQFRRSQIMLGGFIHEAVELVNSIRARYLGNPDFEPLRALVLDYQYEKTRKQAKKVRNSLAFHLDNYDETTRVTISRMKPATYTLWSGENQQNGNHYFEFADFLDMSYLGDVFPDKDGCEPDEAGRRVLGNLLHFAVELLNACKKFEEMLWETTVSKHVY